MYRKLPSFGITVAKHCILLSQLSFAQTAKGITHVRVRMNMVACLWCGRLAVAGVLLQTAAHHQYVHVWWISLCCEVLLCKLTALNNSITAVY